ncbi:DUF3152 domain-containing protein [Streptomyces ficellus]|uniref:DUF3152 domain-containing protein n=1 Tax=Streptomyces ficellus TaxID=1977088 RepID=A0ABT7Z547_9ACTN|nr:DUF3152 domain-containing protein [Streptomyces ficellus]MDN3294617.1 DUF3152 domain-containing protein [Streptomyces ficellus]
MGRHSRKGPAPQGSEQSTGTVREGAPPGIGRRRKSSTAPEPDHRSGIPPHPGAQQVRGGHPEQHEPGGGWGEPGRYGEGRGAPHPAPPAAARAGHPATGVGAGARIPGPRREFVEAFDAAAPEAAPGERPPTAGDPPEELGEPVKEGKDGRGGKGLTFAGIAAAAVTTVLAVVVAGQVTGAGPGASASRSPGQAAERPVADGSSDARSHRSDERAVPPPPARRAAPVTYRQLMAKRFPLDPKLKGSGQFQAVPGFDKAPGTGRKVRYRVDVEKGLGLDPQLFARAVQETLNDDRSWAHGGAMTFERISTGQPEFVITLASPGTTGVWCAKSGLDTTVDNVSCDSAATERVMINAYRWAQGSQTYGVKAMHTYRQMLINHEVGHRLGHNHVTCRTPGALAPVMQQQTKSLEIDGIKCRPNPWVFPGG